MVEIVRSEGVDADAAEQWYVGIGPQAEVDG